MSTNELPPLVPFPKSFTFSGESFFAAGFTLRGFAPFLDILKAFRDDLTAIFGETFFSPQVSAFEQTYAQSRTHVRPDYWGANFSSQTAPIVSVTFLCSPEYKTGAYRLSTSSSEISIAAADRTGMQHGCATLAQLCLLSWDGWRVRLPGCIIEDEPGLSWRGVMVDSVRHFQSIQDLKKLLSSLSLYKINRLHWHLSDDQGWRIELPAMPLVTEIGSYRQGADPNRNGQYTREEIRDLVSYAEARGITIVPELDLPGHVQAVLAAYPDLSCTGGPFTVRTTWGIAEDVLCMGNPKALEFAKNAWDSILDLFPGDWVHIGGDECPTIRWESCPRCNELKSRLGVKAWVDLHGWFIKEISTYLQNRGKIVFGWDEVLDSTMDNGAGVFHWRSGNQDASLEALNRGRDLVRCPQDPYYFDRVQIVNRQDSPGFAGTPMATVKRVFEFDPFAGLPEDCLEPKRNGRGTLLGIQVNAWTEFMSDFRRLEYMIFPRVLAAAETGWRGKNRLSWDDFAQRLGIIPVQGNQVQRKILDMLAINYCSAAFNAQNL